MEDYMFVCIGTNKLLEDSFGPRVGNILTDNFSNFSKIKVFGTMKKPIHFENAPLLVKKIKQENVKKVILIDSAFCEDKNIGETYVSFGGIEIGKAFGKSFYFPAHLNIKTIVSNRKNCFAENNIEKIEKIANEVAERITKTVFQF